MCRFKRAIHCLFLCLLALAATGCFDEETTEVDEAGEAAASPDSPRLAGAVSRTNSTVLVSFSKPMGDSALDIGNYSIVQSAENSGGTLSVLGAAFDGASSTAVLLTTRSQSDVTYRLTVTNMRDVEGNTLSSDSSDARTTTFSGTAPRLADLVDTDEDGLYDSEEQRGWRTTILLPGGEGVSWQVSSDPLAPDSDGDGLRDDAEKRLNADPRDTDTDDDGLLDNQEFREILSNVTRQDTDGDGLIDGEEFHRFLTSPLHRDTDGDQLPDGDEVLLANRNARAADVPLPAIKIGNVDLQLDVRFVATSAQGSRELEQKSVATTLVQTQNRSYSNTDSTSHQVTAKATLEAEYSVKASVDATGVPGGEAGYSVKGSVETGYTGQWTSSFTASSSNESAKTLARTQSTDQEVTQQETVQREVRGASMRVPVSIRSIGSIAFTIENLQISAFIQDPQDPGRLVPVATLVPAANMPNSFNLGPLVPERGPFIFTNDQIFPALVEDLMRDPRGLIFKVANYDITDELKRNFAFTSQAITDRTTPLVIDYGGADSDGDGEGDTTDRFHVATSSGRAITDTNGDGRVDASDRRVVFDAQGKTVGITVREALEGIVGLKHFDEDATPTSALSAGDIATSFSTRIVNGVRVLWRVRDVSKELGTPLRQWEVLTPDGIAAHNSNFLERVISPQNGITLAHVQDLDDDRIPANWEFIYGCSDRSTDTDQDGLSDGAELFTGWTVDVVGRGAYRTFSSCARADSDRDGLTDAEEGAFAAPTDPKQPDTDRDGVTDSDEINGYTIELRLDAVDPTSSCSALDTGTADQAILCTSDPLAPDSDGDTLADGDEVTLGTDPTVNDGDRVFDDDADGLSNFDEISGATVTYRRVSTTRLVDGTLVTCTPQNDGIAECDGANEPTSDPQEADTDNDGLTDGEERERGTHPRRPDTDGDGQRDATELAAVSATCNGEAISAQTGPLDADMDNDLLSDGAEISTWTTGSWVIRVAGETPYVACPNPTVADADLDELVDGEERALTDDGDPAPTDPNLFDTDADGVSDAREAAPGRPTDPLAEDQWVDFRYTQIAAVGDCDGGLFDEIGEFVGALAFQVGLNRQEVTDLRQPPFNYTNMTVGTVLPVQADRNRRFVLRPGDTVRAFSHDFWECDGAFECLSQTTGDDDLTEDSEEFAYPVADDTAIFEHTCGGDPGLETTLVVTELP